MEFMREFMREAWRFMLFIDPPVSDWIFTVVRILCWIQVAMVVTPLVLALLA